MITLPAIIESIATRKDKTIRLTIGTQELAPSDAATIFSMAGGYAYVAIKREDFAPWEVKEMDELKADIDTIKSPSQRLRAILYRNWEQNAEGDKDFATYYMAAMEKLCQHYKNKLDG